MDDQSLGLRLSELVDELGMDGEDVTDGNFGVPSSNADLVSAVTSEEGARVAKAFCQCAEANGFGALIEAMTFCGLRDELPKLLTGGVTVRRLRRPCPRFVSG